MTASRHAPSELPGTRPPVLLSPAAVVLSLWALSSVVVRFAAPLCRVKFSPTDPARWSILSYYCCSVLALVGEPGDWVGVWSV